MQLAEESYIVFCYSSGMSKMSHKTCELLENTFIITKCLPAYSGFFSTHFYTFFIQLLGYAIMHQPIPKYQ